MGAQSHTNSVPPQPPGNFFLLSISVSSQTIEVSLTPGYIYMQPTSVGVNVSWQPYTKTPASSLSDELSGRHSLCLLEVPLAYRPSRLWSFKHTLILAFPLSLSHSFLPLTYAFGALFQMNTFSVTLSQALLLEEPKQGRKLKKVWEIDKPAFIWDAFAILCGT